MLYYILYYNLYYIIIYIIMDNYDYVFKVLIIGGTSTGKSSILLRCVDDCFVESYISTIGVDFKIKTFECDGKIIKLQIWDTAGQERFMSVVTTYFRGAQCAIVTFDLTSIDSFTVLEKWLSDIKKYCDEEVIIQLVGNKSDMVNNIQVTDNMMQKYIDLYGPIIKTSAKLDINIKYLFDTIVYNLKQKHAQFINPKTIISDQNNLVNYIQHIF